MVTFSPHLLCNSPRLNDLASRSNEYLTSKRFFLTISLFRAIEGREHRAPARSADGSRTLPFQFPPHYVLPRRMSPLCPVSCHVLPTALPPTTHFLHSCAGIRKNPFYKSFACHSYALMLPQVLCLPLLRKHPGWQTQHPLIGDET